MPLPDDDSTSSKASSPDSHSRSPTPPPVAARTASGRSKKKASPSAQLIGDLPVAREEALGTFDEIPDNNYQYKNIGRSREATEDMRCECTFERGEPGPHVACGARSNCINRLTQIECLPGDCRCRAFCQNQRFQRKQYADIEIVLTEKKGYGLRAEGDLIKDSFIYEYVGDVVNPTSFKKRMRDYAEAGIRHFYFMMLQKDEFIDATKSGGIGRFANHSCDPNCYVAKWTVGEHVRMGIFARRNIVKHEELTFNYNVDRYGHKAQKCYCGEAKCVGYIGGKTQTDIATVDDLYLDALGITDADELRALKGTKKTKGKKLDDPDFLPEMRPIIASDVPTITLAVRQTQNREMLVKLLTRFRLTNDESVCREMLRLRCLGLMKNVLDDYASDSEIVTLALESIRPWPLAARNKVEDSHIESSIKVFAECEDEKLKALAQPILDHWATLPTTYRIPKRIYAYVKPVYTKTPSYYAERTDYGERTPPHKRARLEPFVPTYIPRPYYPNQIFAAPRSPPRPTLPEPEYVARTELMKADVQAIIAAAVAQKAADDAAAAEAAAAAKLAPPPREKKRKERPPKPVQTPEEKEANKEKRLLKLVGAVVVKCMSKYGKSLERDTFKKHAKELTQLIADKEKKSSSYRDNKLEALSDEKVTKIKKFAKEYIAKVVRKAQKSGHRKRPPSSSATQGTSSAVDTPNSLDGVDLVMTEMTVEEAMDMDPASESEDEGEGEGEGDAEMEGEMDIEQTGAPGIDPPPTDDASLLAQSAADPRRRPPNEDQACP
ncbi:hypothetical protein B0H17DRAFT_1244351 [Mycena rosella]|uniref:Histone-lysine N-methyltransferase, H3 lysine-36 specific n=1 Tax=Mycena rosella TaxID=1033263 RepID=A0AAD7DWN2_MYCRO|nr:hypothetical protein B0H17DRAFT_1244351 [Mycena rosella]